MNIVNDVRAYVAAQLPGLYAVPGIDTFGAAVEAIIVRGDPSSAVETEYIDGSTTGVQSLSFYARSKTPGTAVAALDSIRALLDQPEVTLTAVLCIKVMPRALPTLVSKEETGESVYVMTVDVSFDGKNSK